MAARSNPRVSPLLQVAPAAPREGSLEQVAAVVAPWFDAALYAAEYADVSGDAGVSGGAGAGSLLRHFCERGWREGRNPNRAFDTATYLLAHPDVDAHGINPYYHYLSIGQAEGRAVSPAALPSEVATRHFGRSVGDWVTLMRPAVDAPFYLAALGFDPGGMFDPVAHYAYRGWLEGRDPNPQFRVADALAANPAWRAARLNPLLDHLLRAAPEPVAFGPDGAWRTTRFSLAELAAEGPAAPKLKPPIAAEFDDPVLHLVAAHLDRDFYLAAYPDVRRHGSDPVLHYCEVGWTEGRDPAATFSTRYYLTANPDVAARRLNPFWHYLAAGQAEGRLPQQPGFYQRQTVERAQAPNRTSLLPRSEPTGVLTAKELQEALGPVLAAGAGLALSVGHDRYTTVTGGLQLFLGEEQAKFSRLGVAYLNVSPLTPALHLADDAQPGSMLTLLLDGLLLGVASAADLVAVLGGSRRPPGQQRLFLVHCLLGHSLAALRALHDAVDSTDNRFWVHDYSSLCAGYNLLRNDVAFCGAPPPESMACRVCVYGGERAKHLAAVRALFEAVPFDVVAPSMAALSVWRQGNLPHRSAQVHAHCRVVAEPRPVAVRDLAAPVRVAFAGYAKAAKGWPIWRDLIASCSQSLDYEWLHLGQAGAEAPVPGVEHHEVITTRKRPNAMSEALARLEVDLVAVLSPWPETFSYVTFEAFAAGADVVCLATSGNVADAVLSHASGVVVQDWASLIAFFTSGEAARYGRAARRAGPSRGRLLHEGTSATLPARLDG